MDTGFLIHLLITLIISLIFPVLHENAPISHSAQTSSSSQTFVVTKIIDGDTIEVDVRGNKEKVRLLGIDTPETKDPRKPVECFGEEASKKLAQLLTKKQVKLIDDPTQGNRDRYKRLLRYVYLEDGTFVNKEMVKQGYAFSYKEYPTSFLQEFYQLESEAQEQKRGLWSKCFPDNLN